MLPNPRAIEKAIKAQEHDTYTIACVACHKPLWKLSNFKHYGTKVSCDKAAYEGVPEYNDIWSNDGKECSEVLCWFCGDPWLKAITVDDKVFPKPFVLELDL